MNDSNAITRIGNLFILYHAILRRHGMSWLVTDIKKIAVYHVLLATRPAFPPSRLESDLEFLHHELRKNFIDFMRHATRLSEAFQLVDDGPKRSRNKQLRNCKSRSGNKDGLRNTAKNFLVSSKIEEKFPSVFLVLIKPQDFAIFCATVAAALRRRKKCY